MPEPARNVIAPQTNVPKSSNSSLPLAVGLSLGVGISVLVQSNLKDVLFPKEPVPEKVNPTSSVETKLVEELIGLTRKQVQLETQMNNMQQELREQSHQAQQQIQQSKSASVPSNANVFELSQVIEANNLANVSARKKENDELRRSLVREHLLKVEGEILKVENKYRPVINRIRELEVHLQTQKETQLKERPAKILWISCQSLLDKMRYRPQGPLEKEPAYDVLKQYASDNNQLAISVLDALPGKAVKQGFESEDSLIDRFSKIEKVCRRVSLIDERGGGLTKYLLSFMQSLFIVENYNLEELEDEFNGIKLVDPTKWTTFDVLARVRCCLQRRNLDLATRYANQLKGQARVVARDWIRDARMYLEVREAFSVLSSYAESVAVDAARQNYVNE